MNTACRRILHRTFDRSFTGHENLSNRTTLDANNEVLVSINFEVVF